MATGCAIAPRLTVPSSFGTCEPKIDRIDKEDGDENSHPGLELKAKQREMFEQEPWLYFHLCLPAGSDYY
jgi:hypothetical protein